MQGKLQGKEEGEVEKKQASLTSASVKRVLLSLTPHTSFCLGILTDSTDFDVKTHTQLNTGCEEERRERKQKEAQTYESSRVESAAFWRVRTTCTNPGNTLSRSLSISRYEIAEYRIQCPFKISRCPGTHLCITCWDVKWALPHQHNSRRPLSTAPHGQWYSPPGTPMTISRVELKSRTCWHDCGMASPEAGRDTARPGIFNIVCVN